MCESGCESIDVHWVCAFLNAISGAPAHTSHVLRLDYMHNTKVLCLGQAQGKKASGAPRIRHIHELFLKNKLSKWNSFLKV